MNARKLIISDAPSINLSSNKTTFTSIGCRQIHLEISYTPLIITRKYCFAKPGVNGTACNKSEEV